MDNIPNTLLLYEFWRDQLKHAHALNALVDNHRVQFVQIHLAFHGILIGGLIFKADVFKQSVFFGSSDGLSLGLASGIALIGIALFGAFFTQHIQMRVYKAWIAVLEKKLAGIAGASKAERHHGTLYSDRNPPNIMPEKGLVMLSCSFIILNVGVSSLLMNLAGASSTMTGGFAAIVLFAHLAVVSLLYRAREQQPALSPEISSLSGCHYRGMANEDSRDHKGWFVGPFMKGMNPLLSVPGPEIKWGVHKKNEKRTGWDDGSNTYTLALLIDGRVRLDFADGSSELFERGDFMIWGPGTAHTWEVLADCTIITIRWYA